MFKEILINNEILDEFIQYADQSPSEICGLISGKHFADVPADVAMADTLHLIDNISSEIKAIDYVMQPQQMFNVMRQTTMLNKKSKVDLIACIHSHPTGLPIPSIIDIDRAEYDWVYVIYSPVNKKAKAYTYDHQNKEFYEIAMHIQK